MNAIDFTYNAAFISPDDIHKHTIRLIKNKEDMLQALSKQYDTHYASLYLPFDTAMHNTIQSTIASIKKPHLYIVIGIGGSNLGIYAIHQALYGTLYNEHQPCQIYYVDTLDAQMVHIILLLIKKELTADGTVFLSCISKSGTTLETIINFSVLSSLLKLYYPETWQRYCIIITDYQSPLWHYARDTNIQTITIPLFVGGRFSVLSPVGLFSFALLGIDIEQLCAGARAAITNTLESDHAISSIPALSASIIYQQHLKGITIHDTFLFAPNFAGIGAWYRQLCAESLGKKNKTGELVGITPTVSIGSTDLHSMGQLYIGGPQNRLTTFVYVPPQTDIQTAPNELFGYVFNNQHIKISYNNTMHSIMQATQDTYRKHNRPYMSINIPTLSAYTIGMLMQYKMIEILYLGYLLQVNPFDQPDVEEYKTQTRALLDI